MPRSALLPFAGKRGLNMNFNHEELMLMMLYNTGTRLGLVHELRLMQCYLMPDETALRELSESVIEKLNLLTDAEFSNLTFPLNLPPHMDGLHELILTSMKSHIQFDSSVSNVMSSDFVAFFCSNFERTFSFHHFFIQGEVFFQI